MKQAQQQNILEKALSDGPSATLRPLFNSNMTKVSVIMWSPILIWAYRSGVFDIPKDLKNACKAGDLNCFGYAKNTTYVSSNQILRPLYNDKDILFFGLFPIVITIVNINCKSDHEGVELAC